MRFALIALAIVFMVATVASNPSGAGAAEPVQYDMGHVIALGTAFGAYEVQVLTTGQNLTITVPQDLWEQLDIGDTVIHDADGWHLLRKGPMPDGE